MEVNDNKVTIVTPAAELPEDIDVTRAEADNNRAEARLASKNEKLDHVRAELAVKRAIQRLEVVTTFSGR